MSPYTVHIDARAERRLQAIARDTGRKVEDLIASAAEEEALAYFRHRSDDPGRPPAVREVA